MSTLNFASNFNNKMRCYFFSALRLRNDTVYKKGATLTISLGKYDKGKAKIVDIEFITLEGITDRIAFLDAGKSADKLRKEIKEAYKNKPQINWATQEFACMILEWQRQSGMNNVFDKG